MVGEIEQRAERTRALYRRYGGLIYNKCRRMLGDRQEAEDAMQETFFTAFRVLEKARSETAGTLPWLHRIATNVCLRSMRSRRRRRAVPDANVELRAIQRPQIAGQIGARQLLERLSQRLDERDLQIVVGHFIDGMDQGQVAAMLGITRRSVVRRVAALRHLVSGLSKGSGTDPLDSDGENHDG